MKYSIFLLSLIATACLASPRDLARLHPDNARVITARLDALSREYPEAAGTLEAVSTPDLPFGRRWPDTVYAYAHRRWDDEGRFRTVIYFNPRKWALPNPAFADEVATHEFGHIVDYWLTEFKEDRKSQRFKAINFRHAPSHYGHKNEFEAFAEGFMLRYQEPPSKWKKYTKRLEEEILRRWRTGAPTDHRP